MGWIVPSRPVLTKLFISGSTIGTLVDSLHNQCLLQYLQAPIAVRWAATANSFDTTSIVSTASTPSSSSSFSLFIGDGVNTINAAAIAASASNPILPSLILPYEDPYLFYSSWIVPPLLGIAYVVLGGILPRLATRVMTAARTTTAAERITTTTEKIVMTNKSSSTTMNSSRTINNVVEKVEGISVLRKRAILAVITTGCIIKLSQLLQTQSIDTTIVFPFWFIIEPMMTIIKNSFSISQHHVLFLSFIAALQWIWLDRTLIALIIASIVSIGGPLSELPFIMNGFWEYLPQSADYYPFQDNLWLLWIVEHILPTNSFIDYAKLSLSSITGPCYFAVTMDAIALGRYFEVSSLSSSAPLSNVEQK